MRGYKVILLAVLVVLLVACGGGRAGDAPDFYVTMSVRVDRLAENLPVLPGEMHELVPPDGVLFPASAVYVFYGENVFDVLQRATRQARLHMVARFMPIVGDAYVEAIGNIFVYDGGALSGWMFSVNGVWSNVGASAVEVRAGDDIVWAYTLDLGRDLGAEAW